MSFHQGTLDAANAAGNSADNAHTKIAELEYEVAESMTANDSLWLAVTIRIKREAEK